MLLLDFESTHYMKIVEDDSERTYDNRLNFGRSNRRKVKKYDGAMLRRVHKLREKLKYEMDSKIPKIRRELRIKYKKLKKRID